MVCLFYCSINKRGRGNPWGGVILSGEKRHMWDNECQNSCDLVIDLGEAATFIPHSSFAQSFYS